MHGPLYRRCELGQFDGLRSGSYDFRGGSHGLGVVCEGAVPVENQVVLLVGAVLIIFRGKAGLGRVRDTETVGRLAV